MVLLKSRLLPPRCLKPTIFILQIVFLYGIHSSSMAHGGKIMGRDMYPVVLGEDGRLQEATLGNSANVVAYFVQPAAFGSSFPASVLVNLMIPPTPQDAYLCSYPESLVYNNPIDRSDPVYGVFSTSASYSTNGFKSNSGRSKNMTNSSTIIEDSPSVQIGLLVRRGICTVEQKVIVLAELQQRLNLTGLLQYLIVYEDDLYRSNTLVTFTRPIGAGSSDPDIEARVNDIGIAYLPYDFLMDIELRIQTLLSNAHVNDSTTAYNHSKSSNNSSPILPSGMSVSPNFLSRPENYEWKMLYRIAGPDEVSISSFQNKDGQISGSDTMSIFFYLRVLLLALLICFPIARALYLWYIGGGRIRFRRNQSGRIVGLMYVPPRPWWYSMPGQFGMANGTNSDGQGSAGSKVLTEDQFQTLPEVIYDGPTPHDESVHGDTNPNDNDGDNMEAGTSTGFQTNSDISSKQHTQFQTERLNSPCACTEANITNTTNAVPDDTVHRPFKHSGHIRMDPPGVLPDSSSSAPTSTTCTVCSICIDDFVPGEKLILLPNCNHAFHRMCIHPWLLERQGRCPLCKTPAIGPLETNGGSTIDGSSNDEDDNRQNIQDNDPETGHHSSPNDINANVSVFPSENNIALQPVVQSDQERQTNSNNEPTATKSSTHNEIANTAQSNTRNASAALQSTYTRDSSFASI